MSKSEETSIISWGKGPKMQNIFSITNRWSVNRLVLKSAFLFTVVNEVFQFTAWRTALKNLKFSTRN